MKPDYSLHRTQIFNFFILENVGKIKKTLKNVKKRFFTSMECSTDTDTDFLARIFAKKSRVSDVRMYRRVGVESVSVSVPWNASLTDPV